MNITLGNIHKATRIAIRKARAIWDAGDEGTAITLAGTLPASDLVVNEDTGYVKFSSGELGFASEVRQIAQRAHEWIVDPSRRDKFNKPFLRNILRPEDLLAHPEIIRVATHPQLYGAVTKYLGQVPWLVNLHLWWTPPNSTAVRSQLWHYDHRDTRQAKIFINLSDVDDDCGPLHFLSAVSSLKVDAKIGYSQGHYTDEQLASAVSPDEVLKATGPSTTGFIVDTARCLHYGSRGNLKDRLVLMASYARVNCVSKGSGCEVLDPIREEINRTYFHGDVARTFSNRPT
jgi:hypothetical protein